MNHLNSKVQENGKMVNQFSQDITDIIDSVFAKYLKNKNMTFEENKPGQSIIHSGNNQSFTAEISRADS
jgi:hypothetical protein